MGLNCMLDKKRKNNVQKIHFQKCLACSVVFVIWTAIYSSRASRPQRREDIKSYGELSDLFDFFHLFRYFFFFLPRRGVLFCSERESLAFTLLFFVFCFSARTEWRRGCARPSSQAPHPGSVYIHSKLYMLVFFFFFSNKSP